MPLGQTEIFTPAATRKLIVPEEATSWWGVDPGTRRAAIAIVDADNARSVETVSFAACDGGDRLMEIFEQTRRLAGQLSVAHEPGVVVVEQPSGKQPNPALSYAVGVVQLGLWAGVRDTSGHRVALVTVSSSSWKKAACGAGNAYKPKSGKIEDYAVWRWARDAGYRGRSFDECDAWGIAEWACREYALDPR